MEQIDQILVIAGMLATLGLGYIANELRYKKGKKILNEIRKFVVIVDDAVYDDKISEEEFRAFWEQLKGMYAAVIA